MSQARFPFARKDVLSRSRLLMPGSPNLEAFVSRLLSSTEYPPHGRRSNFARLAHSQRRPHVIALK